MRTVSPGKAGGGFELSDKNFFGPAGVPPNIQTFTVNGTWTKPIPPAGKSIIAFQIYVVGAGGGGCSGGITQNGAAAPAGSARQGGGGGGFCLYRPAVASVPATAAIVLGVGGTGGVAVSVVGSIPLNGNTGVAGTDGSGNTTVAATVIVCNPGTASSATNNPGGGATCSGAWGGTFTVTQGGTGSINNASVAGSWPTSNANRQTWSNGVGTAGGAGQSTLNGPGGGGVRMAVNSVLSPPNSCWGGGVGATGASGVAQTFVGGAGGTDFFLQQTGPSLPSNTGGPGGNGAGVGPGQIGQGGGSGGNVYYNPTTSPAGNNWTLTGGNGGNGGPGGGGGTGGGVTILGFPNPGTVTAGNGGAGGNGQVVWITVFG